jgi:phosphate transport system protein
LRHFAEELRTLSQRLLAMGGLAEECVRVAVDALVKGDSELLKQVIAGDGPMAGDLRMVTAAVKINSDLERVGDLAVNIAEAAQRYISHPPVKTLIDLPRMGDLAQRMLREALDAFVVQDIEAAQAVLRQDDLLDGLKNQVFRELLTYMLGDPDTIEPAINLILVSRHLERIGDHATNIAEDVIFIVEARDVRHSAKYEVLVTASPPAAGSPPARGSSTAAQS